MAGESPRSPFRLRAFYELFPYYLAIGMTYEQFWEQDCDLVKYYRKAAQIRQDLKNQEAWLQGAYFYEALADVSPILRAFAKKGSKARPYPKKPFDLNSRGDKTEQKKAEEKSDDKAKENIWKPLHLLITGNFKSRKVVE